LVQAFEKVLRAQGAPGLDGQSITNFADKDVENIS
jgi:hypothetical protein